jgi:hypothetical protein
MFYFEYEFLVMTARAFDILPLGHLLPLGLQPYTQESEGREVKQKV